MQVSRKAKRAGVCAGGADRLSELPDCLLHDILSQLKARQVVQTCVLSRRWQNLWLTCPSLDVDITEFLPHVALHPSQRQRPFPHLAALAPVGPPHLPRQQIEFDKFEDFVDCLLVHRSTGGAPPLDTLQLRMPPCWGSVPWMLSATSNTTKYTSWIRHGLRCSPAALDISGFVKLPPLASSSTRRLTKLRLDRVILHPCFAEHLASGLPVLEDLEISGTELSGLSRIESGTLKHLAVDSSSRTTMGATRKRNLVFNIAAPRLMSLHLAVQFLHLGLFGIVVQQAPSLVQASIRLVDKPQFRQRQGGMYYAQDDDRALVKSLCDLLGSLSHVCALKLYGFHDHDTTLVQQYNPFSQLLGIRPHNFVQPQVAFIPPPTPAPPIWQHHNFVQPQFAVNVMAPPGPGFGPLNHHQVYDDPWTVHHPAMPPRPPPLRRPMLEAILEEEHGGLPVFHGLTSLVLDEILEEEHGGLPVFHGLTSLVLDECETGQEVQTLWRFLHKAPALEKLTLKNCQFQMFPNVSEMGAPQTNLETVSSNLKSVEIIYDDRDDDQGGDQYKVRIDKASSYMIKWKLPATTMIRVWVGKLVTVNQTAS